MSHTVTDERPAPPEEEHRTGSGDEADATLLEDRSPEWLRTTPAFLGATVCVAIVFVIGSAIPLWYTDLWGHLAYGRVIVETGGLPETEPLLPTAEGMPFVDTEWLSQLVGYATVRLAGAAGLQFLNGVGLALGAALLIASLARRAHGVRWGVLAAVVFLAVGWEHLTILRPQLAGIVCFTALLALLQSRPRRWHCWLVPPLFVTWANLHGSFVVGLLLLATVVAGRAIDVLVRTRTPWAWRRDRRLVRSFVLLELAALASLVNPYGLGLHVAVFDVAANENLQSLVEWQPLHVRTLQGQIAFAVAAALAVMWRVSPRRTTATELLLVLGFGLAAAWTSRMIVWWAPVAAVFVGLHAAAIWHRWRGVVVPEPSARRGGVWSLAALGVAWIAFAITPLGNRLVHGAAPDPAAGVDAATPVDLVAFLRENPPRGLVFNTYEWGDYLLWAGPPEIEVFVNSHAHVVPREVWNDYLRIAAGASGWDPQLARHGVRTVVVDHAIRGELIRQLRAHDDWQPVYEDPLGVVFERRPTANETGKAAVEKGDGT